MACTCADYSSGMLNELISIERPTYTPDAAGGYTEVWGAIAGAPTRAHVKSLSGSERWASERVEATSKLRVVVRYVAGILESDSIVIRSRRCNIRYINNIELADKWLEIEVGEGVAV